MKLSSAWRLFCVSCASFKTLLVLYTKAVATLAPPGLLSFVSLDDRFLLELGLYRTSIFGELKRVYQPRFLSACGPVRISRQCLVSRRNILGSLSDRFIFRIFFAWKLELASFVARKLVAAISMRQVTMTVN